MNPTKRMTPAPANRRAFFGILAMLTMPRPKSSVPPALPRPIEFLMADDLGEYTMQIWSRDEFWSLPDSKRPSAAYADGSDKHVVAIIRPETPAFRLVHADS